MHNERLCGHVRRQQAAHLVRVWEPKGWRVIWRRQCRQTVSGRAVQALYDGTQVHYLSVPAVHVAVQAGIVLLQASHPLRQLVQFQRFPDPVCIGLPVRSRSNRCNMYTSLFLFLLEPLHPPTESIQLLLLTLDTCMKHLQSAFPCAVPMAMQDGCSIPTESSFAEAALPAVIER